MNNSEKFSGSPISVLAFVRKYESESANIRYHLVRRDLMRGKFIAFDLENGRKMLSDCKVNLELAKQLKEDKKGPKFKKDRDA